MVLNIQTINIGTNNISFLHCLQHVCPLKLKCIHLIMSNFKINVMFV